MKSPLKFLKRRNRFILFLLLCVATWDGFAQATTDSVTGYKRFEVNAFASLGVTAYHCDLYELSSRPSFSIGFHGDLNLYRGMFKLETDIAFARKGYNRSYNGASFHTQTHAPANYLQLVIAPKFILPIKENGRFNMAIGLFGDYGLKTYMKEEYFNSSSGLERAWKSNFFHEYAHFKYDMGLIFTPGFSYKDLTFSLFFELGLLNISYEDKKTIRSRNVGTSISYRIHKGNK